MKLELMDINRFIEQRKILQVKSTKIEGRGGKLDSEGFFSEEIFGRVGSPGRKTTFGYIDLNVQTPTRLTSRQIELLKEFEKEGENHTPSIGDFLGKVKEFINKVTE